MDSHRPNAFTRRQAAPSSRRGVLSGAIGGFAALLAAYRHIDVAAKKKKKPKKPKTPPPTLTTITRTFANTGQITIPGAGTANPYPSVIQVAGFDQGRIIDVDVTLRNFSHGDTDNVAILLVKDTSNAIILGQIVRDLVTTDVTITLDDEALIPLSQFAALSSGRFQPTNYFAAAAINNLFPPNAPVPSGKTALSTFDGLDPNGTWRLFVSDVVIAVDGAIAGG
jgi:hypothetical protein